MLFLQILAGALLVIGLLSIAGSLSAIADALTAIAVTYRTGTTMQQLDAFERNFTGLEDHDAS